MKVNISNTVLLLFMLLASVVEFAQRYVSLSLIEFWGIGIFMIVITFIGFRLNKSIGPTLAFFNLVHFSRYANEYMTTLFSADFSGTYFLLPIVLFTFTILFFKPIRETITWWKRDVVTKSLLWEMVLAVVIGSFGMYWYLCTHEDQLVRFLEMLPRGSFLKILSLGLVFAGMNAAVEEFIIRGMIWNGLEKVISNPILLIVLQALIFGASHYFGLPGGIVGVTMIFTWSLFIGYVRWKSGGLLAVIGLHFFSNLAQFFMLYLF